jgi:hypothetical protein
MEPYRKTQSHSRGRAVNACVLFGAWILPRINSIVRHRASFTEIRNIRKSLAALGSRPCKEYSNQEWIEICDFITNTSGNMIDPVDPPLEDIRSLRADIDSLSQEKPSKELAVAIWNRLRLTNSRAAAYVARFDKSFEELICGGN